MSAHPDLHPPACGLNALASAGREGDTLSALTWLLRRRQLRLERAQNELCACRTAVEAAQTAIEQAEASLRTQQAFADRHLWASAELVSDLPRFGACFMAVQRRLAHTIERSTYGLLDRQAVLTQCQNGLASARQIWLFESARQAALQSVCAQFRSQSARRSARSAELDQDPPARSQAMPTLSRPWRFR